MDVFNQYTLCEWTRLDEILYVKVAGLKVLNFEHWYYGFAGFKACPSDVDYVNSFILEGLETSFQVVFWFFFPAWKYSCLEEYFF